MRWRLVGLGVWFSLRVREVPGSNPGQAHFFFPPNTFFLTMPTYLTSRHSQAWLFRIWGNSVTALHTWYDRKPAHMGVKQLVCPVTHPSPRGCKSCIITEFRPTKSNPNTQRTQHTNVYPSFASIKCKLTCRKFIIHPKLTHWPNSTIICYSHPI